MTTLLVAIAGSLAHGIEGGAMPSEGTCLATGLIAVVVARRGVALERTGFWSNRKQRLAFAGFFPTVRGVAPRFSSPALAQLWMEWRRNARVPLILWRVMVALVLGSDLIARMWLKELEPAANALALAGIVGAFGWMAITGLNLARDGSSCRLTQSTFSAVRPLADGAFAQAKLLVGLGIWFRAMMILFVGGILWALCSGNAGELARKIPAAVMFLVLSLHVLTGILPLCLSGRIGGFPWSLLPLLVAYTLVGNAVIWLSAHPEFQALALWVVTFLVVLKLLVSFWGFRRAIQRQLCSASFVAATSFFWLGAVGLLYWYVNSWEVTWRGEWTNDLLWIPAVILVVPLTRLALSPLAVAWNRHR